mgnify:CR=1 FL=1
MPRRTLEDALIGAHAAVASMRPRRDVAENPKIGTCYDVDYLLQ